MPRMLPVGVFIFLLSASSGQQYEGGSVQGGFLCGRAGFPGLYNSSLGESRQKMFSFRTTISREKYQLSPFSKRMCTRTKNSTLQQTTSNRRQFTEFVEGNQKNFRLFRKARLGNYCLHSKSTGNLIYPGSIDILRINQKIPNAPSSIPSQKIRKRRNSVQVRQTNKSRENLSRSLVQKRRRRVAGIKKPETKIRQSKTSRRLRLLSRERRSNVNNVGRIRRSSFRVRSRRVENRRGRSSGRRRVLQRISKGRRFQAKGEIRHAHGTGRRAVRVAGEKRRRAANRTRNNYRRYRSLLVRRDGMHLRRQRKLRRNISSKINQNHRVGQRKWGGRRKLRKVSSVANRRSSKRRLEAGRRKTSISKIETPTETPTNAVVQVVTATPATAVQVAMETPTTAVVQVATEIRFSNNITENNSSRHSNVSTKRGRGRHSRKRNRLRGHRRRSRRSRVHKAYKDIHVGNFDKVFNENVISDQTVPRIQASLKRLPRTIHGYRYVTKEYTRVIKQIEKAVPDVTERKRREHFVDSSGHILGILGLALWMTSRPTSVSVRS